MTPLAACHPIRVVPTERVRAYHHGCGRGGRLGLLCDGIGLLRQTSAPDADDIELVASARANARDEQFPDARAVAKAHAVAARVPSVEVAAHRNAACVRGPDRKARAGYPLHRHGIRAERLREVKVSSFVEQMQVDVAQQRPEAVWVLALLVPFGPVDAKQIRRGIADKALEESVLHMIEPPDYGPVKPTQHLGMACMWQDRANDAPRGRIVRPEQAERITMHALRERLR